MLTSSALCAQCYLKDTAERLEADIARAAREGWAFAAKTVRGAYLVFERARAAALGAASPVQDTLADTHANYDRRGLRVLVLMLWVIPQLVRHRVYVPDVPDDDLWPAHQWRRLGSHD